MDILITKDMKLLQKKKTIFLNKKMHTKRATSPTWDPTTD